MAVTYLSDIPELSSLIPADNVSGVESKIADSYHPPNEAGMSINYRTSPVPSTPVVSENFVRYDEKLTGYHPSVHRITCIEVSDHVSNCPVCSLIYKPDLIGYNIAMGAMAITSIMLFKHCIDNKTL